MDDGPAAARLIADAEFPADALGALNHPDESEMSARAVVFTTIRKAAAIILNCQ